VLCYGKTTFRAGDSHTHHRRFCPTFPHAWTGYQDLHLKPVRRNREPPRMIAVIFSPLRGIQSTSKRPAKSAPRTERTPPELGKTRSVFFTCSMGNLQNQPAIDFRFLWANHPKPRAGHQPETPVFMRIYGPCSTFVLLSAELCESFSTAKKNGVEARRPFIHADFSIASECKRNGDRSDRMPL